MLQKISITNYAIIDFLEVEFSKNINIITGETGAGKSIIIGALSLILGERADSKSLMDQKQKCVVEGIFDVTDYDLKSFFSENDLDLEKLTILRREITSNGKSRAFINDTPVNLSVLKELGAQLVNLHSQHETLALNNPHFQIQLVDALVRIEKLLEKFRQNFYSFKNLKKEIAELLEENKHITDKDYLEFQYRELTEAELKNEELASLENELKTLENAEAIKNALENTSNILQQSDFAVLAQLREAFSTLKNISSFNKKIEEAADRIDSSRIELEDITTELDRINDDIEFNPEKINILNERIDTINRLLQKHKAADTKELINVMESLEQKLRSFEKLDEILNEKNFHLDNLKKQMVQQCDELHAARAKEKERVEQQVIKLLKEVGMPNARFEIHIEKLPFEKVSERGLDKIVFYFSANKGGSLEELKNVASGGELSRLMLVLKSLFAEGVAMPTLIFDEIDTGISGETAIKVGDVLKKLGKSRQVISITHLPQIARIGNAHLYVYKEDKDDRTITRMRRLTQKERITEIAKMIGGEKFSDKAIESAKELLLTSS